MFSGALRAPGFLCISLIFAIKYLNIRSGSDRDPIGIGSGTVWCPFGLRSRFDRGPIGIRLGSAMNSNSIGMLQE